MINDKETIRLSKLLSLALRHRPEVLGIELDNNGWTEVSVLLHRAKITSETLDYIVETNNKQRFAFNADKTKIRANQGHSVTIELGYVAQRPPDILFHGTSLQFLPSILRTGLDKRQRHHVHLSPDIETALKVGERRGKPIVLEIDSAKMYNDQFAFYLSTNGVWLTDHVPPKYIKQPPTSPL